MATQSLVSPLTVAIPLEPVTSSNVAALGYDRATRTLVVEFKPSGMAAGEPAPGALYHYLGVPIEAYRALRKVESVGKALAATIKPTYPAVKVDRATLTDATGYQPALTTTEEMHRLRAALDMIADCVTASNLGKHGMMDAIEHHLMTIGYDRNVLRYGTPTPQGLPSSAASEPGHAEADEP